MFSLIFAFIYQFSFASNELHSVSEVSSFNQTEMQGGTCEAVLRKIQLPPLVQSNLDQVVSVIQKPIPTGADELAREMRYRLKHVDALMTENTANLSAEQMTEYFGQTVQALSKAWLPYRKYDVIKKNISYVYAVLNRMSEIYYERFANSLQDPKEHGHIQELIAMLKRKTIFALSMQDVPVVRMTGFQEIMLRSWLRKSGEEPYARIWSAKVYLAFLETMYHDKAQLSDFDLEFLQRIIKYLPSARSGWVLERTIKFYLLTIRVRWLNRLVYQPTNHLFREMRTLISLLVSQNILVKVKNPDSLVSRVNGFLDAITFLRRSNSDLLFSLLAQSNEGRSLPANFDYQSLPDREGSELATMLHTPVERQSVALFLLKRHQSENYVHLKGPLTARLLYCLNEGDQKIWFKDIVSKLRLWEKSDIDHLYQYFRSSELDMNEFMMNGKQRTKETGETAKDLIQNPVSPKDHSA